MYFISLYLSTLSSPTNCDVTEGGGFFNCRLSVNLLGLSLRTYEVNSKNVITLFNSLAARIRFLLR